MKDATTYKRDKGLDGRLLNKILVATDGKIFFLSAVRSVVNECSQ